MATMAFCKYRVVEGPVQLELNEMLSMATNAQKFQLTIILGFIFVGFVKKKRSVLVFYR
jgi:hypothetical protein